EARLEADVLGLLAQQSRAQRVKGADGQTVGGIAAEQLLNALVHLARGLVGEGDGGDVLRSNAALAHLVSDLVRDDAGLAAARACQDEERCIKVPNGFALLGV